MNGSVSNSEVGDNTFIDSYVESLEHNLTQSNTAPVPMSRTEKRVLDSEDLTGIHCELADEHN